MMHNSTIDDEFEDFEDLDDGLLDDDWDAFDDGAQAQMPPQPQSSAARPVKKASSLPRFISIGVILLLIVGASYFFYSNFIVPTANQKRQAQLLQSDASDSNAAENPTNEYSEDIYQTTEGFPPTPTPIDANATQVAEQLPEEGELVPMPDFENIAVERLPDPSTASYEEPVDNAEDLNTSEENDGFEDIFANVDTAPTTVEEPAPAQNLEAADNQELADLKAENEALRKKIEDYEEVVADLNERNMMLEKKNTSAPAPVKKTMTQKVETQKSSPAPKQNVQSRTTWVLRSARPGKAVVSQKGSNDTRNVEVGDQLSGIGKIQSISDINGRWVIQGSSGKISQ